MRLIDAESAKRQFEEFTVYSDCEIEEKLDSVPTADVQIKEALDEIKKYCENHKFCNGCKLYGMDNLTGCVFRHLSVALWDTKNIATAISEKDDTKD